jgi:signal transduction histidine kinase
VELVPFDALWISWTLQTTFGVVLLFALWGMRRVFREQAIGAIARGWLAFVVAMIASLAAAGANGAHAAEIWRVVLTSIEGVARIYMIVQWYPLAALLAGKPVHARTARVRALHAALAVGYATADVVLERVAPWVHLHLMEQVYPLAFAWLAIAGLRVSHRAERNAGIVRWLALGYVLFVLRVEAVVWLFGENHAPTTARAFVLITVIQVAHVAAFGVVCLVVALALERTATLEQAARLREAEARLMNARRLASLGEMAARIAHDFNNVLMIIMGGVDLARRHALTSPAVANQRLADVASAANDARALIAQLLAFGSPVSSDPSGCDVAAFLRERSRNLTLLAGAAATVDVMRPAAGTRVGVAAGALEQVVYNLVTNARDAMPNGGSIRIEAVETTFDRPRAVQEGQLPAGKYLRISVEDDGTGIPLEVRAKIFEPFFTTKGKAGTGLGLATVYAIATHAGGDVAVTSVAGKGTRFDVFLPIAGA